MTKEQLIAQSEAGQMVGRELASETLHFLEAIAERLGLTSSDHRCLELVDRYQPEGPMTAGKLAELTGLTTGAITGVVDRLERAGFVRREKSAEDRRQVQIKLVEERRAEMDALFEPMCARFEEMCSEHSQEDLETVFAFMRRISVLYRSETQALQGQTPVGEPLPQGMEEQSAPLGLVRAGTFELTRGASNLTLGTLRGNLLYRVRHEGPAPRIRNEHGQVALEYNRSALRMLGLRRHALQVELNGAMPWELSFRGGASKVTANLRDLTLKSFELRGGASGVTLQLPAPAGTVPVRITGGSSQLKLLRPRNTPIKVQVTGGVSNLGIDKLEVGAVGGTTRWESPDYEASSDRYDVQITGGASQLLIAQD